MTSIKIKFRPSTVEGKEGSIYYQVIHRRVVRQLNTDYKVFEEEWDEKEGTIIVTGPRSSLLSSIKERITWDIARLRKVVSEMESKQTRYTADEVIAQYLRQSEETSLFAFMHHLIAELKRQNKVRTSETYTSALHSIMAFLANNDLPIDGISSDLMLRYESWLKSRDVHMNTISFYMRILRAVYNRAVEKGLVEQRHPFRHVYTGIGKTLKRAVPLSTLKKLKSLDLTSKPSLEFARDMFLFSFYTRGMSFVDMAFLRKKDLQCGILTYRRRKTGQLLTIKWEKCMEELVAKYRQEISEDTIYLLPIIRKTGDERRQYTNALHLMNYRLRQLSDLIHLQRPLTMYVARHSWASAAKSQNIPISVISEGMGHDNEATTQIYLASLESTIVDKANKKILGLL